MKKDQIIILENQYCERIPLIWKGKNFENTGNSSTLIKYSIKNKNYIYFHNFILKEKKNYLFPTYNSQKIYFNLNNDFFPLVRKRFLQKKYQLKKCNIY
ncbi:MAG: hypothetical protein KatS3mg035_2182 [Bacteroidia bacterium]|nr:MAG: hypothetical protein KatS3mg035_2182 [Bacteroidia bacterium]